MGMTNTSRTQSLRALVLTVAFGASACAGDTVYLPSERDLRAAAQGLDGDSATHRDATAAEDAGVEGSALGAPVYCRVIEEDVPGRRIRFACDESQRPAPLVFPDCPCTADYGCGGYPDGGAEPDPGFGGIENRRSCVLLATSSEGAQIECDRHRVAAYPCGAGGCVQLPAGFAEAIQAGLTPEGVCSLENGKFAAFLDADGYESY